MTIEPCNNEALLNALMDDELPPAQAEDVRRHLETCPGCRRRLERLQQTDAMIRNLAPLEPSADFDRTFWRKVADLEERRARRSWLRFLLSGWRPFLASGLAAGLAAAIFIYIGLHKRPTAEEMFMAQNMELLENYEMINQLDLLEQWDAMVSTKEPS